MSANLAILMNDTKGVFDVSRFLIGRSPASVSYVPQPNHLPSCLDMLIKLPGGEVTIPEPYASDPCISAAVEKALAFDESIAPGQMDKRHLYLTVDQRSVEAGKTHRNAGWHFDGMQGTRFATKLPACRQYVVSDRLATEFYSKPLDPTGLDEAVDDFFLAFEDQIPEGSACFTPSPLEMVCMSAYQVHRSPICEEPCLRTFIRLDVSAKEQDREGNTPNPLLPAPWSYVPRPSPVRPDYEIHDSGWEGARTFHEKSS